MGASHERRGKVVPVNDAMSHVTSPVLPTTVYSLLTREIKLICAEIGCLPMQTAMHLKEYWIFHRLNVEIHVRCCKIHIYAV